MTNLNIIPGRRIEETLGIAYGYASVKEKKGGRPLLERNGDIIPWKDTSEDFEALFREAEDKLIASCSSIGGDAVIKVEGKLSRDGSGNPEMLLMGTAVKLDVSDVPVQLSERAETGDEEGGHISVKFDGDTTSWEPPQATSPTVEVLKKLRGRGTKDMEEGPDDSDRILALAREVGISQERARLFIDGGFDTLERIAGSSVADISAIEGINPTQARIVKKKVQELLSME